MANSFAVCHGRYIFDLSIRETGHPNNGLVYMKIAKIFKRVNLGNNLRLDVTKSTDSYNGLIYEGRGIDRLKGCVAIGLHQPIEVLIDKAKNKING